jgi:hypothetical protein
MEEDGRLCSAADLASAEHFSSRYARTFVRCHSVTTAVSLKLELLMWVDGDVFGIPKSYSEGGVNTGGSDFVDFMTRGGGRA